MLTLDSGIDVGQGINVGPGKFGKNDKRRALNNSRPWKIWQNFEVFIMKPTPNIFPILDTKFNKRRAF